MTQTRTTRKRVRIWVVCHSWQEAQSGTRTGPGVLSRPQRQGVKR